MQKKDASFYVPDFFTTGGGGRKYRDLSAILSEKNLFNSKEVKQTSQVTSQIEHSTRKNINQ